MATLIAYLDASGSVADPNCLVFTLAGYVATEEQWKSFAIEWQKILDDFGVTSIHMKDFSHSRKEFESWKGDTSRRTQFSKRLIDVIRDHLAESFGVSLNMNDYRKVDLAYRMTESLGAYAIVAASAMGRIERWQRLHRAKDSISICIERGDAQQGTLATLGARTGLQQGSLPKFINKKECQGRSTPDFHALQAADLLAYEHAKCFTDAIARGKQIARESLYRLSERQRKGSQTWIYLDEAFVRLSCQAFNVRKRTENRN